MRRFDRRSVAAGLAGLAWLTTLVSTPETTARETRRVAGGRYELTVGFLTEPAYEGEPNGLYLRVGEVPAVEGAAPPTAAVALAPTATLEALTPTPQPGTELTAEVAFGPDVRQLRLEPDAQPGVFRAVFVPTQPGDYAFRIRGMLDGEEIAEEFRTGPDGIPPVVGVAGLQFPQEVPVGPSLIEALDEREAETERARTLGAVGVILGVVGLLAGGIAVVLSRRPPPAGMP
jgi:hypothetical protein